MSEKDFFKINNIPNAPLQKGTMLVSPPLMADGVFHKSVILLLEHNDEGSLGLIINKPTNYKVSQVLKELPDFNKDTFFGGPVSANHIQVLHRLSSIADSVNIINDVFWGGDFKKIFEMINLNHINETEINFYLGYAGWSPEQLNKEMEENFWILVPGEKYDIWNEPETLWETIITELGLNPKIAATIPDDPMYN